MRFAFRRFASVALIAATLSAGHTGAQNKGKPRPRLPNYWGKLDLSDAQKEKYYVCADFYDKQIDDLELRLEKLKEQKKIETFKILTPAQRKRLAEIHGVPFDETPPVAQKPAKKKAAEAKPPIKKGAPAAGKPDDQPPEEPADDPENSAKSAPKKKAWTVDEGEPMPPAKKETDPTKPPAADKE